jgi:hypothetical protein
MKLGGVGVTQPTRHGPFQLRLKFGKQAYCVIEIRRGEEAAEVAKKLRARCAGGAAQRIAGARRPRDETRPRRLAVVGRYAAISAPRSRGTSARMIAP